jgi:hypothetical protein
MFLNTNCVMWFSQQILHATFLIWRNEGDVIKINIGLHVKDPLFLLDFNETWICSRDLKKIPKYTITESLSSGSRIIRCGQRNGQTERNFWESV